MAPAPGPGPGPAPDPDPDPDPDSDPDPNRPEGYDVCESGLSEVATCTYQEPATGLVYDLNPLRITTANLDHKIVDVSFNASYIFNVCSNVVTPRLCTNTSGGGGDSHNDPAPAYQLFTGDAATSCSRLGSSVSNGSSVRMGLVEKTKPARGVYLTYSVSQGAPPEPRRRRQACTDGVPMPLTMLLHLPTLPSTVTRVMATTPLRSHRPSKICVGV